jgi:hypothetical protein
MRVSEISETVNSKHPTIESKDGMCRPRSCGDTTNLLRGLPLEDTKGGTGTSLRE